MLTPTPRKPRATSRRRFPMGQRLSPLTRPALADAVASPGSPGIRATVPSPAAIRPARPMSAPPPSRPVDDERLLEQTAWIRALARSLVADAHLAEDLAQDACVAALERPPADAGNLRGWLAAVVRNLHRQVVRS